MFVVGFDFRKEHKNNNLNMENIYSYTEWCIKSRLDLYQKLESKILTIN
jgi:hypothetical protein